MGSLSRQTAVVRSSKRVRTEGNRQNGLRNRDSPLNPLRLQHRKPKTARGREKRPHALVGGISQTGIKKHDGRRYPLAGNRRPEGAARIRPKSGNPNNRKNQRQRKLEPYSRSTMEAGRKSSKPFNPLPDGQKARTRILTGKPFQVFCRPRTSRTPT